jgi:hypothetical protein
LRHLPTVMLSTDASLPRDCFWMRLPWTAGLCAQLCQSFAWLLGFLGLYRVESHTDRRQSTGIATQPAGLKREAILAQDFPTPELFDIADDALAPDWELADEQPLRPSLPIILFSAACGVGSAVIALYLAYRVLVFNLPFSAGIATFCLLAVLGITGGGLSVLTRSSAIVNITFSCGLILLSIFFFAFCSLLGALAATLILNLR